MRKDRAGSSPERDHAPIDRVVDRKDPRLTLDGDSDPAERVPAEDVQAFGLTELLEPRT